MIKLAVEEVKASGGIRTLREKVPDDLLILSASYEPRTSCIADCLSEDYRSKVAVVYVNKEFLNSSIKTRENLERMKETIGRHSDVVTIAEGSWADPATQLRALRSALSVGASADQSSRAVTFDITTFNRESLLVSCALLYSHYLNQRLRVFYVSPLAMGDWLSRGFRKVRNVMGFSGIQDPNRHSALVVLSGFEPERTLKLIEEHEPARVLLGIGDPPTDWRFLERNMTEQKLVLARQDVQRFNFPANDVIECESVLSNLIKPLVSEFNVVLAPMSTKLSTLSAFLVATRYPEVQLTYALPGEYNVDSYSSGVQDIYSLELSTMTNFSL